MPARKTAHIGFLIDEANAMLLNSADSAKSERLGIISFISHILHSHGRYRGFMYLSEDNMKDSLYGHKPGVRRNLSSVMTNKWEDTDDSRVAFYK